MLIVIPYISFSQLILVENKSNGEESKIYISAAGDKLKIKSRTGIASAKTSASTTIQNVSKSVDNKGVQDIERKGRIKKLKESEIPNAEVSCNREKNEGLKKPGVGCEELKKLRAELANLEAGGNIQSIEESKAKLSDADKNKQVAEQMGKETEEKSMKVELTRFDQNKIYKITPSELTYQEFTLDEEKARRTKTQNKMQLTFDFLNTGITKDINGKKCVLWYGTATMGMPFYSDSIWVSAGDESAAKTYWTAMKNYYEKVYPEPHLILSSFYQNPDYMNKLFSLTGLPVRRTITNLMAAMSGQKQFETYEQKLESSAPIDDKEFALPEGLKKK